MAEPPPVLSPLQLRKLAAEKRKNEAGDEEITSPQSVRSADQGAVLEFDVANSTGDWVSSHAPRLM
jgi:hypothetical protein